MKDLLDKVAALAELQKQATPGPWYILVERDEYGSSYLLTPQPDTYYGEDGEANDIAGMSNGADAEFMKAVRAFDFAALAATPLLPPLPAPGEAELLVNDAERKYMQEVHETLPVSMSDFLHEVLRRATSATPRPEPLGELAATAYSLLNAHLNTGTPDHLPILEWLNDYEATASVYQALDADSLATARPTAPAATSGAQILSYQVQCRKHGTAEWFDCTACQCETEQEGLRLLEQVEKSWKGHAHRLISVTLHKEVRALSPSGPTPDAPAR